MRFTNLILVIIIISSCNQPKSNLEFRTITDLKNKFEVEIPNKWDVEKNKTNSASSIIFSDTTKTSNDVLVYFLKWESFDIKINGKLINKMDSIVAIYDQEPSLQKIDSTKIFKYYKFDTKGFDSLNHVNFKITHYYLTNENLKGHLYFNIWRGKKNLTQTDSILIKQIFKSIKIK